MEDKQLSNRVLVQQQYQEMQLNIRNNLAPLNRSCDLPAEDKDKDTKVIYPSPNAQP